MKKRVLLILLFFLLIISFLFLKPVLTGKVVIDGLQYDYIPKFRFVTVEMAEEIELGITYEQLLERIGPQNGELNYNGIINNVFYRVGIDKYVVFHFEWDNNYLWWKSPYQGRLTGIFLYNHKGLIRIIKEIEQ